MGLEGTLPDLPRYRCHKVVRAAKIAAIEGLDTLVLDEGGQQIRLSISTAWATRHDPKVGGYFVVYEDGYTSYSPAQAFEEGYSRVDAGAMTAESAMQEIWGLLGSDCGPSNWAGILKDVRALAAAEKKSQ